MVKLIVFGAGIFVFGLVLWGLMSQYLNGERSSTPPDFVPAPIPRTTHAAPAPMKVPLAHPRSG